jgi:UDP-N-acetyl-2-amino-2-deoxyglucuronate dehydrogenase
MIQNWKPIANRPLRLGLVGCGRISRKHLEVFDELAEDFELVATCDPDEERARAAAGPRGSRVHTDLGEMLEETALDVVALCTPSGLHPTQTIQAARAGVNVITEKPMATRWSDGLRMVRACDEARVRLLVVKQNRYNSTLQALRRAVREGRFGRIHMVHSNVFWTRPQEYYDQDRWRGTWELDGGALMNQASHYVDLLDWLIGPIERVQAMTGTLSRNIEVEDSGVMNIRWRSGALGSMSVTMLTYPKNLEGSLTILGEHGSVRIGGVAVNQIQHWEFADERDYDQAVLDENYETESVYGFGHLAYYRNAVEVLRGEAEPTTDGREGLRSLELLIAAYLSARDGRTVALPLEY